LLGILAAAGVFSSGGGRSPEIAPSTTTPPTTVATTTTTPIRPSATPPTVTLKPGATGAQVKLLQRSLATLGYPAGKVDGDYGAVTERALASFQRAHHLVADGILGPKTLRALTQALRQ